MSKYFIKTVEKILYGFGFGTGMGASFYILPSDTRNNSQKNYDVNDKNINKHDFQNVDQRLFRIEYTPKYEDIYTKSQKSLYNETLKGWGWYYKY